jgi:sugar phosphate isomerase/epimerase
MRMPSRVTLLQLLLLLLTFSLPAGANEFFAMDTVARGEPTAVATMLRELGYDGIGGTALDDSVPAATAGAGLRFYNGYHVIRFSAEQSDIDPKLRLWLDHMHGSGTVLWLAIEEITIGGKPSVSSSASAADSVVIDRLRALAEYAAKNNVSLSLYPHTGYWLAHFEDAIRLANELDRSDVGVTFNLCHWLKVEGSARDPLPLIRAALPRLNFVTINGADTGDTGSMGWDRLIQPLGWGSFDTAGLVKAIIGLGYRGPFGLQGYGIPGEPRDILETSMTAWKTMTGPVR